MDITVGDIRFDIQDVKFHPSWYLTPWYSKIMLDLKDIDIRFKYQI
jgi:hypothetical protein